MGYKIKKTVLGIQGAKKKLNNSFFELTKSLDSFDIIQFFNIYNKLFYNIPKSGANSHNTIIERSSAYVNNAFDAKEAQIESLIQEISDLSNQLTKIEPEHPFFPNGSLLSNPKFVHQTDIQPQAYVMEKGQARAVMFWGQHNLLRSALGYSERYGGSWEGTGWEGYLHPTQGMLDKLPKGPPIFSDDDLFLNEYKLPEQFTTFLDIQAGLQTIELSEGQTTILLNILEEKAASQGLTGENDAGAIAIMDINPIIEASIEKYNANTDQATTLVLRAQEQIRNSTSWASNAKEKSIERGTTWFRQMVAEIAFTEREKGNLNY